MGSTHITQNVTQNVTQKSAGMSHNFTGMLHKMSHKILHKNPHKKNDRNPHNPNDKNPTQLRPTQHWALRAVGASRRRLRRGKFREGFQSPGKDGPATTSENPKPQTPIQPLNPAHPHGGTDGCYGPVALSEGPPPCVTSPRTNCVTFCVKILCGNS